METEQIKHRKFLNNYYGKVKYVYDLSRKYFLFGRDKVLQNLLKENWGTLVEIGPGTGRNLAILHRKRPQASYAGVEASDEMLIHAQKKCPWANLQQGFAEDAKIDQFFHGQKVDRILFSYCLSMVQDPEKAIAHLQKFLSPQGKIVIVDFADLAALPAPAKNFFLNFLKSFHVRPVTDNLAQKFGGKITWGPGRYYIIAEISALSS